MKQACRFCLHFCHDRGTDIGPTNLWKQPKCEQISKGLCMSDNKRIMKDKTGKDRGGEDKGANVASLFLPLKARGHGRMTGLHQFSLMTVAEPLNTLVRDFFITTS